MVNSNIERPVLRSEAHSTAFVTPKDAPSLETRRFSHSNTFSAKGSLKAEMSAQATNEELDELFHVKSKLTNNVCTPCFERVTLQLIMKKFVVRDGDIIRLTLSGKEQIRQAISGDLAK